MIKAILFDFNGVIIDDEPIQLQAYQEVLRDENVLLTDEEYYGCLGLNDRVFVEAAFERAGQELTEEKLQSVIQRKTAAHGKVIEKELPLFPGVVTFVKVASREYSLGVVSMALSTEINKVLRRAKLVSLFDVIVNADDVNACKPDPACYELGLRRLNEKRLNTGSHELEPCECLAIEDSPPGILAACRAGMRTLGITNTVAANELRAAGADVVTTSLADWTVDAVRHVFDY
jgi:beta-phosphoglucomutase